MNNKIIRTYYIQYEYNEETRKYHSPVKKSYEGRYVQDNLLTLLLMLNRGVNSPYDEEAITKEYKKINTKEGRKEFCCNHPVMLHFVYMGQQYRDDDNMTDIASWHRDVGYLYYIKYVLPFGIEKPEHRHFCDCGYGAVNGTDLTYNAYIFHEPTQRLFIVGCHCIEKFGIRPMCRVCHVPITIKQAVHEQQLCKQHCKNRVCKVCKIDTQGEDMTKGWCQECYALGCNPFNVRIPTRTIANMFKDVGRKYFIEDLNPNKCHKALQAFILRINKFL